MRHKPADAIPDATIQTGTGVDPTAIDYALDHLRDVCVGYPVTKVHARLTRVEKRPATILVQAEAVVKGHSVQASAVGRSPQRSIDEVADQLATKLAKAAA